MNNGNQECPWEDGIAALLEDLSEVQDQLLDVLTKKVVRPGVAEARANPRARSAKLRAAARRTEDADA